MTEDLFPIVHEDDELLVIDKPQGLVCHPTKGDAYSSLISRIRLYLGEGVPAHLVNRLDRETGGLTLVAKTDEAARELRKLWEAREVEKEYQAIVHGRPPEQEGIIEAPLGKDEHSVVAIKDCVREDGSPAATAYRVECSFSRAEGTFSLLRIRPKTGKKHQIRIHLAYLGCPIVGDKLYGGDEMFYLDFVMDQLSASQKSRLILPNHTLHAAQLEFLWRESPRVFEAPAAKIFKDFVDCREIGPIVWPPRPA